MAKTNKKKEELRLKELEEQQKKAQEFETEAYTEATPDPGMETTFTKVVGSGGPVPIVAPKHTTVQLQPIIVPLAVVPYMSSDSDILKTEGKPGEPTYEQGTESGLSAEFRKVDAHDVIKSNKRAKLRKRIFSLFTFLFTALGVLYFVLAHFKPEIFSFLGNDPVDPIGWLIHWIKGDLSSFVDYASRGISDMDMKVYIIMYLLSLFGFGLSVLISFIGILFAKYPGGLYVSMTLLSFGAGLIALIMNLVKNTFSLSNDAAMIFLAALAFFDLILVIVFATIHRRKENEYEDEIEKSTQLI